MTQLMYGPSDKLIPRSHLSLLATPAPMGPRHHPYPFHQYVNDVQEGLDMHGLTVVDEDYVVTEDHQQFFGLMEITGKDLPELADWRINVGVRGSHNQTLPRGLILGSQVIVCSNLCFHGNIGNFKTKQTTEIAQRLPFLIRNALMAVPEMVDEQNKIFDRMKNHEWKPRWGDAALVDMYRQGAFSSPQLTRAIDEWHEPSFEHGDYTLWRLLNAGTEAIKPTGANVNMALVEQRTRRVADHITALAA